MADEHNMIQLAREERDARIRELHDLQMSQRFIANSVGCSLGVVNYVIKRSC